MLLLSWCSSRKAVTRPLMRAVLSIFTTTFMDCGSTAKTRFELRGKLGHVALPIVPQFGNAYSAYSNFGVNLKNVTASRTSIVNPTWWGEALAKVSLHNYELGAFQDYCDWRQNMLSIDSRLNDFFCSPAPAHKIASARGVSYTPRFSARMVN